MNVPFINEALKTNEQGVCIVFTKADGSERVMRATKNPSLIPQEYSETESTRSASTEACRVYDLDLGAWRSFRYDRLINMRYIDRGTEVIFTP